MSPLPCFAMIWPFGIFFLKLRSPGQPFPITICSPRLACGGVSEDGEFCMKLGGPRQARGGTSGAVRGTQARAVGPVHAPRDSQAPSDDPPSHDRLTTRPAHNPPEGAALVRAFEGHAGPVLSLAVSADGRHMLSGSQDGTLKVWLAEKQDAIATLGACGVRSVALSGDGRLALSGSDDRSLKLWDVREGRLLGTMVGHEDWITSVAFSADGRVAASVSYDGAIKLWDVATRSLRRNFDGQGDWLLSVAFSPDGRTLAAGGPAVSSSYGT